MADTKSGFITILGKPNVGKSSIMNRLLGEKVAIVTSKPQTTRTKITGVLTKGETQLVFIDTPGLHKPVTKLSEHMVKAAKESVAGVDVAVIVVEPYGNLTKEELDIMASVKAAGIPAVLVINKIDKLQAKDALLERIKEVSPHGNFDEVLPVSAIENDGIDKLLEVLERYASPSPHYFPDDALTDQPERVIVAELIREKILLFMFHEIPHGVMVDVEKMRAREKGDITDIDAVIYCEKQSHKGMIIGKNGAMLKKIASAARLDIEAFLDCRVNLQCWVKVKEDWRNKESFIKDFGLS